MRPAKPRLGSRSNRHDREQGQVIVLFALCLVAIIAMAGLLIDGGMLWGNRRAAQGAADAAALAAAKAAVAKDAGAALTPGAAGQAIANANGFATAITDCGGNLLPNGGVVVNRPPVSGPHVGDNSYVEVVTTKKMTTTFAGVVGQTCWMVSARAVASIGNTSVAQCSFCSLNNSNKNHTLVLKNGATLRVDGDIYVNSSNQDTAAGSCVTGDKNLKQYHVCGDAFDVFGAGGSISARTIRVVGGWETHDSNIATADALATPCPYHPQPPSQTQQSNVCIGQAVLPDPLNNAANPGNIIPVPDPTTMSKPAANSNGCTATSGHPLPGSFPGTPVSPVTLSLSSGSWTVCPGLYNGGIAISGTANVNMLPGVYYMAGGGFSVIGGSTVDGSSGVMIYSSGGTGQPQNTTLGSDPLPAGDKAHTDVKGGKLKASDVTPNVGDLVTFTLTVSQNKSEGAPTGSVVFYDGAAAISGCTNVVLSSANGKDSTAQCVTSYGTWGSHQIAAYYCGWSNTGICAPPVVPSLIHNPDTETINVSVNTPAGSVIGPITITTTGNVKLYGPTSGRYSGLTLFQDRTSDLQLTISPGAGLATCTGTWLTADVPHVAGNSPPAACGALGGIRGTIYAADPDALVYITASGLANLQVISGKIQIDSDADARFAFTPSFFANGNIHLVE